MRANRLRGDRIVVVYRYIAVIVCYALHVIILRAAPDTTARTLQIKMLSRIYCVLLPTHVMDL